jgi:hypothetical protein
MNDSPVSAGKRASVLGFLLTIVLVVAGFVYLLKTAYSSDPLWFWPRFEEMPVQVVIQCHGRTNMLEGTSPDAKNIAALVNQQISGKKRFDPLSLTEATYTHYQTDPGVVTLELLYAEPVRIHMATMHFTNITSLLIPLEGRYANTAIVFGLIDRRPAGGSIHMETNQPIIDYLSGSGLCSK